jgi:hypothetical protein
MNDSNVIESSPNDRRMVQVEGWTLTIGTEPDAEPEIADADLAPRLGMELKRLRELSERHEQAGNINPRKVDPNKSHGTTYPRGRGRPGTQRFYGEADALFLVTRSERPEAVALTKEMIRVYMLARRGLLSPPASDPAVMAALAALSQQVAALSQQVAAQQAPPMVHAALPAPRPARSGVIHDAPYPIDPASWRRKILSFIDTPGTLIFTPDGHGGKRYGVCATDLWRAAIRIPVSKIERRHAEAIYDIMASMRWEYVRKESVREDNGTHHVTEIYKAPHGWTPRR